MNCFLPPLPLVLALLLGIRAAASSSSHGTHTAENALPSFKYTYTVSTKQRPVYELLIQEDPKVDYERNFRRNILSVSPHYNQLRAAEKVGDWAKNATDEDWAALFLEMEEFAMVFDNGSCNDILRKCIQSGNYIVFRAFCTVFDFKLGGDENETVANARTLFLLLVKQGRLTSFEPQASHASHEQNPHYKSIRCLFVCQRQISAIVLPKLASLFVRLHLEEILDAYIASLEEKDRVDAASDILCSLLMRPAQAAGSNSVICPEELQRLLSLKSFQHKDVIKEFISVKARESRAFNKGLVNVLLSHTLPKSPKNSLVTASQRFCASASSNSDLWKQSIPQLIWLASQILLAVLCRLIFLFLGILQALWWGVQQLVKASQYRRPHDH